MSGPASVLNDTLSRGVAKHAKWSFCAALISICKVTGATIAVVWELSMFPGSEVDMLGLLGCRYYQCNITDAGAVEATVARVQADMGPITGIVHGAALNK
jgi:NAD(P)-dependent dehydrogenase (short-subunit alcohol dehydrogenase family)